MKVHLSDESPIVSIERKSDALVWRHVNALGRHKLYKGKILLEHSLREKENELD